MTHILARFSLSLRRTGYLLYFRVILSKDDIDVLVFVLLRPKRPVMHRHADVHKGVIEPDQGQI